MKNNKGKWKAMFLSMMLVLGLFVVPIKAEGSIISVNRITGIPTHIAAGEKVILNGHVEPSTATNQTIVWKIKDSNGTGAKIEGYALRVPVGGDIIITATIHDGIAASRPYVQDFKMNVEKNDVEKISIASAAVKKALAQYNATNNTTKQDITRLAETAIANSGVTRVSMSWSSRNDFSKTNATTSSQGRLYGQIDLMANMRFSSISLDNTIPMLPKPNTIVKDEPKVENTQPTVPKVEESPSPKIESTPKKETAKVEENTSPKLDNAPKKEFAKVEDVFVNDKRVDASNYTINQETGTIVFKEEFIKALPEGKRNVTVNNTDGESKSNYELTDTGIVTLQENEMPATLSAGTQESKMSDDNLKIIVPLIVGIGALSGLLLFYKKKKANKQL